MRLPDGEPKYRTMCGAILTIITLLILIVAASLKLSNMFSFRDYTVLQHITENFFENTDRVGVDEGFMVAATLASYSG